MENMVRPENTARLTVTHKPTMFTYKDLRDVERLVSARSFAHSLYLNVCIALQVHSHLGMSQGFAGYVALHLGLVD